MLYEIRCNLITVLYLGRMCRAGYTRCSGRTWVYLFDSSLQNLAVPQYLYPHIRVPVERSCEPLFDGAGLAGFKSRANAFY